MKKSSALIPVERIQRAIFLVRAEKVMLDADLAALYGVSTGNLNKAVKRNLDRFPLDFMFQLTSDEAENLRFQIGISSHRGPRHRHPFPFRRHPPAHGPAPACAAKTRNRLSRQRRRRPLPHQTKNDFIIHPPSFPLRRSRLWSRSGPR